MTDVDISDKSGCTLKLMELDGELFPRFPVENLKSYLHLPLREDDVILCAYPKSGTHWLWEVSMMLLKGQAETIPFKKSFQMLEFLSAEPLADLAPPRVFNTHMLYDALPRDALALKTRLILVARNPKDVAVSFFNHHIKLKKYYDYSGTFNDWLLLFTEGKVDYGSWFDYMTSWEKVLDGDVGNPIHVIMYEDMKEDPIRETTRLAKFLGVTLAPELIEKIAHKCSFTNMAVDKKPFQDTSDIMFRKGEVGDWKNTFTVAQSEMLDTIFEQRMKDSTLKFRFAL